MAVLDVLRSKSKDDRSAKSAVVEIPPDVKESVARGQERLAQIAPARNEALEMWRGNQYWYVDEKGVLQQQYGGPSGVKAAGKPSWRVREAHNLLIDVVAHEVSAATQRVPSFDVVPSTGDPEDASAASVAAQVALYGYDKWKLRDATVKAVTHAVVADEAFAWVYWDPTIGPYIEGENIGVGDVRVEIYSGNQVYWEPGQRFERSDWHAIDMCMTPAAVRRMEGFDGGELTCDADSLSKTGKGQGRRHQVLVSYFLERPSPTRPAGRWLTLANDRQICPERPYPGDGAEPCLRKLAYIIDPDSDRDMGLVRHLVTGQRTHNDAKNKQAEWKNLHLMGGRIFVTPGLLQKQRITDEPGAVYEIPQPNENIKIWEAPGVPPELFQMADDAKAEVASIAAQNDVPSGVEAGKAIQALIERDQARRQSFIANLAEWISGVVSDGLALVQERYTERRTLHIKGDFGWDSLQDFLGSNLRGQGDVRVFPSSIEPLTRQAVEQRVMVFADRQWISPETAMHAINAGTAENLIRRVELAEARVQRIIRRIKEGPEALMSMPPRIPPPNTNAPPQWLLPNGMVPGWMPQPWDNLRVWRDTFESFFQTETAEMLPMEIQEVANLVYRAVLELEAQEQMQQAMAQQQMAQGLGMGNAAKPQGPSPMPDQSALTAGGPPTPNQPPAQALPSPA